MKECMYVCIKEKQSNKRTYRVLTHSVTVQLIPLLAFVAWFLSLAHFMCKHPHFSLLNVNVNA